MMEYPQGMEQNYSKTNTQVYNPISQIFDPDTMRWQLSPQKIVDKIYKSIRGVKTDPFTGREYIDEKARMLNDEGADYVKEVLESYINENVVLTKLDENQIYQQIMNFIITLKWNLVSRSTQYQTDLPKISSIVSMCVIQVLATLNRSLDGTTLKYLTNTTTFTTNEVNKPEKKGLFGLGSLFK